MRLSTGAQAQHCEPSPNSAGCRYRNVLLLAYYYPPQNTSGAARPARFARYFPASGYNAHVVSAGFGVRNGKPPERVYAVPGCTHFSPSIERNSRIAHTIERKLLPYQEELSWVPFAFSQGADIIRKIDVSAIISTSPPIATHLAALSLKRRFGLKWVADFRDPLLGNPFRNRKFARPYDVLLERLIFWHADVIIANTEAVAEMWRKRYPRWHQKVRVLWNGFDPETILTPAPIPRQSRKVFAHVGNIYGGRHPGVLLESLERLFARHQLERDSLLIRLIGPMDPANLQRLKAIAPTDCYFEVRPTTVSQAEARAITASSDYLLLLDINEQNLGLQVPAKLFDYICVGRPILALTARDSSVQHILSRSGVPFRCLYKDMQAGDFDREVLKFLELPSDSVHANTWFWKTFDAAAQTAELAGYLS